jgi:hypothetical protein
MNLIYRRSPAILSSFMLIAALSRPASAQVFNGRIICNNEPPIGTRVKIEGKFLGGYSVTGVDLSTTFFPELKSRMFVPNFFVPRVATSFSGSQDAGFSPQESVTVTGIVRGERLSFDSVIQRFRLTRVVVQNPGSRPCLPQPQGPIAGPPTPPPPPGPTPPPPPPSCVPKSENGYYCPPIAFAPINELAASSKIYAEPQLTENIAPSSLSLGKWEGFHWEIANNHG